MAMGLFRQLFFSLFYIKKPPWDTGISPPELVAFINSHPPGRALDLGCGTGTNAITLAQNGWQVTGVDFIGRAIRQARRKAKQAGVDVVFHKQDVTHLRGIMGTFDLILDIGCFHNLSPTGKAQYIHQLHQLLAPGGTFLMYAFSRQPDKDGSGVSENDMLSFASHLTLVEQAMGYDHGSRPSMWITYQKT